MGACQVIITIITFLAIGDVIGQQGQLVVWGWGGHCLLLCSLEVFSDFYLFLFATAVS